MLWILNNDLGEPIKEHLTQPAGLRDYKEGGSFDFYLEYFCQENIIYTVKWILFLLKRMIILEYLTIYL